MTETTDTTTSQRPDPSAAKDSLRRTLRRSEKGRRVLVRIGPGPGSDGDTGPPGPTGPITPPPPVSAGDVIPYWVEVYATWFPMRAECRTHAGGALQHLTVLTGPAVGWKGQQLLAAIGDTLGAEMSASAALKDFGQRAAEHPCAQHTADLQKAAGAYLEAVGELATAVNEAGLSATKHVVKAAKQLQKENFGAFHPDLATGLVFGKQCVLLTTSILTALAPVTLGISVGVAALINVAAKGIESAIVEAKVDTSQETVKKLTGRKVSGDNAWVEHGEKIHSGADKLHGYAEKGASALKTFADSHAMEGLKAGSEVAEGSLGGVGTVLSFAGFYLDIQKYDTTRKVMDAAPAETIKKLEDAVDAVYAMQASKILPDPVALVELVTDPTLGQGVRILLADGKAGVLYSSGIFIPSDPGYRFEIFLNRARKVTQGTITADFGRPVQMLAEDGTDFTVLAWVHADCPAPGWEVFADWYQLRGRLTPEGQLRNFPVTAVPPFSRVPARKDQVGKGTGAYPDWEAACEVATKLIEKAKKDQQYYDFESHPYWAITKVVKHRGYDGDPVETLEHLAGAPTPDDYADWLNHVRLGRESGERARVESERSTDDHRRRASS